MGPWDSPFQVTGRLAEDYYRAPRSRRRLIRLPVPARHQRQCFARFAFRFDLFEFCEVLDSLFPVFEGAAIGAYEELQATLEAMAESRRWEAENAE